MILWYYALMKAVQINFTPDLLNRLDADEVVSRLGRSEAVRRIVEAYLRRREARRIDEAYARGYGPDFPPVSKDLEGWAEAAAPWPE